MDNMDFDKLISKLPIKPKSENGKSHCIAKSIVKHSPNKLNYWHIEFHINDGIKKIEEIIKSKQIKSKILEQNQINKINDNHWADQIMYFALNDTLIAKASKKNSVITTIPKQYFTE